MKPVWPWHDVKGSLFVRLMGIAGATVAMVIHAVAIGPISPDDPWANAQLLGLALAGAFVGFGLGWLVRLCRRSRK